MGGMGAGCCFGLATPDFTTAMICASEPSTFSQTESLRFGARGVPVAFVP
jgi:hypothetical protein